MEHGSNPNVVLDDATLSDLPSILAIYNDVIRTTTAVYTEDPVTLEDRRRWFDQKCKSGFPLVVARQGEDVLGFGTFGEFRAWPCYRHSVEHSVHVRADARGKGVGRALVEELLERASTLGMHVMIAGVDIDNMASLGLHEKLGFEHVGTLREVGHKFGRWLDLAFLQKRLDPTA